MLLFQLQNDALLVLPRGGPEPKWRFNLRSISEKVHRGIKHQVSRSGNCAGAVMMTEMVK